MIYKISRWIGLTVFSLLILIPSAIVVLGTFKTDLEIYDSPMALPLNWTLDNYRRLLDDGEILTNFKNSILVTSLSVIITLVFASMVSFAIARMMNVTGKVLFVLFSLGLAIPGQVNIIPIYLLFEVSILVAKRVSKKEAEERAQHLFQKLNIGHRTTHKPSELSGGEQQRVAVCRSLMNQPAVIFADEPSGNLDTKNAQELHELFFQLREEFKQTFVIVTHNESFAQMADRSLVMRDGNFI